MTIVDIAAITDLEVDAAGGITILANAKDGCDIRLALPAADMPRLVPALLSASVLAAAQVPPKETTSIGPGHLPVMEWGCGISTINGEPVLALIVPGGAQLMFQFSSQGAQECGHALIDKGLETMPKGRPN